MSLLQDEIFLSLLQEITDENLRNKLHHHISLHDSKRRFRGIRGPKPHVIPLGSLLPKPRFSICFVYDPSFSSASTIEKILINQVDNYISVTKWTHPDDIEQTVIDSSLLVVLLTDKSLQQDHIVFAMEAATKYPNMQFCLIHDASSCTFPGPEQQPVGVRPLFNEKALTFLPDYSQLVCDSILEKLNNLKMQESTSVSSSSSIFVTLHPHPLLPFGVVEQGWAGTAVCDGPCHVTLYEGTVFVCSDCNWGVCDSCKQNHLISTQTDIFLSHKRSSAQVIAGRLFEGLQKREFNPFLDSEAKFKLHDLAEIVKQTKLFLLILSDGIFDSPWCLQEIRSAIENKLNVVLVRDYTYQIPNTFSEELRDVEQLVRNSPMITWMAEFNTPCVDLLVKKYLGAPSGLVPVIEKWLSDEGENYLQNNILNLNSWTATNISILISGLKINKQKDLSSISSVIVPVAIASNFDTSLGFHELTNLTCIQIHGDSALSTSNVLKMIGQECPHLRAFGGHYIQNTPINYLVRGCRKLSILILEFLVVDTQLLVWMSENLKFDVFQVHFLNAPMEALESFALKQQQQISHIGIQYIGPIPTEMSLVPKETIENLFPQSTSHNDFVENSLESLQHFVKRFA